MPALRHNGPGTVSDAWAGPEKYGQPTTATLKDAVDSLGYGNPHKPSRARCSAAPPTRHHTEGTETFGRTAHQHRNRAASPTFRCRRDIWATGWMAASCLTRYRLCAPALRGGGRVNTFCTALSPGRLPWPGTPGPVPRCARSRTHRGHRGSVGTVVVSAARTHHGWSERPRPRTHQASHHGGRLLTKVPAGTHHAWVGLTTPLTMRW